MKGYFSQLAHRTGLSIEPGGTNAAAGNVATAPAVSALRDSHAEVTPLHVEDAFTAPSLLPLPNVSERGNEHTAGLAPPDATSSTENETLSSGTSARETIDANMPPTESRDANPERATDVHSLTEFPPRTFFEESHVRFTSSELKTSKAQEHASEKQSPASEHELVLFSDEVSPLNSAPPKVFDRVEKFESPVREYGRRNLLAQNRQGQRRQAEVQEPFQPTNAAEQTAPVLDEVEQQLMVQNYLNEVRAWVAATPATDETELEQSKWSEVQNRRDVFAGEKETNGASFSQRDGTQGPEVQDLNLSIGSISIVIEEPKKDAPAPTPASLKAEISPARSGSDSTNLSRYYLRSW